MEYSAFLLILSRTECPARICPGPLLDGAGPLHVYDCRGNCLDDLFTKKVKAWRFKVKVKRPFSGWIDHRVPKPREVGSMSVRLFFRYRCQKDANCPKWKEYSSFFDERRYDEILYFFAKIQYLPYSYLGR